MRVYELSKKLGISNKELLALLKEKGYELTSLGVVPAEALVLFDKASSAPEKKEAPKTKETTPSTSKTEKRSTTETTSVSKKVEVKEVSQPVIEKKAEAPKVVSSKISQEEVSEEKKAPVVAPQPYKKGPQPRRVEQRVFTPKKQARVEPEIVPDMVVAPMTVADFAYYAQKPVSEIIISLLKQGIVATRNQILTEKVIAQLAVVFAVKVAEKTPVVAQAEQEAVVEEKGTWKERMPIVVVIGHVDHGKTTLLDYIRKTRVAAKEKGGITQHLGAYEVKTDQGNLVFLDTPGHEAFSLMRARGIKVADIAILIVAADDGVMPQTIEAIKRAKVAEIPVIVAINKIDKASPAQLEVVKKQLTQHDLVPEEWGGTTVLMPISAKLGTGVAQLLDVLVLQSQLMDLKANLTIPAQGYVLESQVEKGRGPVATVICLHGILKVGDYFVAGATSGKVSSLVDSAGERVKEIMPSLPVLVAGFSELPQAGDTFQVTSQLEAKKGTVISRTDLLGKRPTTEGEITIILKADNGSSREAIEHALLKLKSEHKKASVLYAGVGDISEGDISLAADTDSLIYGFNVKVQPNAKDLMQQKKVIVKNFDIIYKLLEDVEELLESGKPVKMVLKKIGEATVLKVFDIKGLGIIAGSIVRSGRFVKDGKVTIWRGKQKAGEGSIKGLQRERKAVKEVHAGFECGFLVDGFDTWEVDDRVECFQEVPA